MDEKKYKIKYTLSAQEFTWLPSDIAEGDVVTESLRGNAYGCCSPHGLMCCIEEPGERYAADFACEIPLDALEEV
jgi:hypothetical protein